MSIQRLQPERLLAAARSRPYLRAVSIFALVFVLGISVWSLLDAPFAYAFRSLCDLTLAPLTFGEGGHVEFMAAQPTESLERASSWDVSMLLSIDGVQAKHSIVLNPRRLLYLPLVMLIACVLAAPWSLSLRQRRNALLAGGPVLCALALLAVWLIAVFLFAKVPDLVYALAPWQQGALRLAYEGWVTPLTNKFIVPLLLAGGLVAWQLRLPATAAKSVSEVAQARGSTRPAEALRRTARRGRSKPRGSKRASLGRSKGSPARRS